MKAVKIGKKSFKEIKDSHNNSPKMGVMLFRTLWNTITPKTKKIVVIVVIGITISILGFACFIIKAIINLL